VARERCRKPLTEFNREPSGTKTQEKFADVVQAASLIAQACKVAVQPANAKHMLTLDFALFCRLQVQRLPRPR